MNAEERTRIAAGEGEHLPPPPRPSVPEQTDDGPEPEDDGAEPDDA